MSTRKLEGKGPFGLPDKNGDALNTGGYQKQKGLGDGDGDGDGVSEALKKKDHVMKERGDSRRRVRGGAPAGGGGRGVGSSGGKKEQKDIIGEGEMRDEAERVANL